MGDAYAVLEALREMPALEPSLESSTGDLLARPDGTLVPIGEPGSSGEEAELPGGEPEAPLRSQRPASSRAASTLWD